MAVIRALWTGGPVTRPSPFYPLDDAVAYPVPDPPPPIIIGGETAAGARLAGRIGDGWTAFDDNFEQNLPLYLESLEAAGRRREDQTVLVGFQGEWLADADDPRHAVGREPRARPGSAGARPAPTARSCSPARRRTSTRSWSRRALVTRLARRAGDRSWHHPTVTPQPTVGLRRAAGPGRADPPMRPLRRPGRPGSACASGATRSGCAIVGVAGPRHGVRRPSRSPSSLLAVVARLSIAGQRAVPGQRRRRRPRPRTASPSRSRSRTRASERPDDVPDRSTRRTAASRPRRFVLSPRHRSRRDASPSRRSSPSSAPRRDLAVECVAVTARP